MQKVFKGSGWIEVICGPMFSGKTEELIRRIIRLEIAKKSVSVFKPKIDNRYDEEYIVSHNNRKIKCMMIDNPADIINHTNSADVVAIDEAQFFQKSLIDVCRELASLGKRIIISGLDKDYLAKPFGIIPDLVVEAEYITKLTAICISCGELATFTKRISNENAQVVLGELDKYEARCRHCYFKGN